MSNFICYDDMRRELALELGEPERVLFGKGQQKRLFEPRVAIVLSLRKRMIGERPMSYPRIGRLLGGRDHTTIISAYWRGIDLLADPVFAQLCRQVDMIINGGKARWSKIDDPCDEWIIPEENDDEHV